MINTHIEAGAFENGVLHERNRMRSEIEKLRDEANQDLKEIKLLTDSLSKEPGILYGKIVGQCAEAARNALEKVLLLLDPKS